MHSHQMSGHGVLNKVVNMNKLFDTNNISTNTIFMYTPRCINYYV